MATQLDLFSAPVPAPKRKRSPKKAAVGAGAGESGTMPDVDPAPAAPAPCPHHGPEFICPHCAECGDTNGLGFLHRAVCGGRTPLRACAQCGQLHGMGTWNHSDWFRCLDCAPHPVFTPMVGAARKKDRRQA